MGFQGPPTPVGQGPCGFDKGRSLAVKSNVKSMASPCLTELDRFKVEGKKQFFRSYFATHGVARLLTFYFTIRDRPLSKPHSPWSVGSAALEIETPLL